MSTTRKSKFQLRKLLLIANYTISIFAISYGAELAVGYPMILLIGFAAFRTPLFSAIYSGLTYALAVSILIFIPYLAIKLSKKYKKLYFLQKIFNPWRTNRKELGLEGLPTFTDITLSIIGFAIYIIISGILLKIFELFPWFQANQTQDVGFSHYLVGVDRALAFVALVIFAPVFEEILFRGWLFGHLKNTTGKKLAIILTSIIFGIAHGQWNVGINVFCLSLILCCLRDLTDSIYASILLHMIKNGVAFYLMYVIGFT